MFEGAFRGGIRGSGAGVDDVSPKTGVGCMASKWVVVKVMIPFGVP